MINENVINENEINENLDIEDLDLDWTNELEKLIKTEKSYDKFYKEDITQININIFYINKQNEIFKTKKELIHLQNPSFLLREEIVGLIKRNNIFDNKKYSLLSLLVCIINIEPQNIYSFLKSKHPNIGQPFLQSITNIDTIKLDKSISIFNDLNEVIILFHEDQIKYTDYKKGSSTRTINNNNNNVTKRIFIHNHHLSSSKKFTRRKY